jgi:hypothetical protein
LPPQIELDKVAPHGLLVDLVTAGSRRTAGDTATAGSRPKVISSEATSLNHTAKARPSGQGPETSQRTTTRMQRWRSFVATPSRTTRGIPRQKRAAVESQGCGNTHAPYRKVNVQLFETHPLSPSAALNKTEAIEQMSKTKKDVNKAREPEPRAGQSARRQVRQRNRRLSHHLPQQVHTNIRVNEMWR